MVKEINDSEFVNETAEGVVVVDCWAAWCGPCKRLGPVVDKVAEEYDGKVKFLKLDVDANPVTCEQQGITSIPTLLFFKNGQLVDKTLGYMDESQLRSKVGGAM